VNQHDVLVTPNESGGYSILVDGIDVSHFVSHFSVSVTGGERPVVTLEVLPRRIRMGLPQALVDAIPATDVATKC